MAQLSSPGVSVTAVDESFYTPAAPGTVPLIVVASQANKQNSAGTGIAPGTLEANAGTVYLLTSQMDLGNTFGVPYFQTDAENNPVNAGEINEYGLQAAYSFLGVSNQAYVVRADLDLAQLKGTATIPAGAPVDGTYWLDTATTSWGVFEWNASVATATNGQSFVNQAPLVITNTAQVTADGDSPGAGYKPIPSIGSVGQYAIVATTTLIKLWYKAGSTVSDGTAGSTAGVNNTAWVEVGSTAWAASRPTVVGNVAGSAISAGDTLIVNGYTATGQTTYGGIAAALTTNLSSSGITASVQNGYLNIYSTGVAVQVSGTAFAKFFNYSSPANTSGVVTALTAGAFYAPSLTISPHYTVPQYGAYSNYSTVLSGNHVANGYPTGSIWIKTTPVNQGANWDIEKYSSTSEQWIRQSVTALYPNARSAMAALDPVGGGINIPVGTVYVKYNDDEASPAYANFKMYQRMSTGATFATSNPITNTSWGSATSTFTITSSQPGSTTLPSAITISFTTTGSALSDAQAFVTAINSGAASLGNVAATVTGTTSAPTVTISHTQGGDIALNEGSNAPIGKVFSVADTNFQASVDGISGHWKITAWYSVNPLTSSAVVTPSATAPTTTPTNGTLWYNSSISDWDILINDGTNWRGYLTSQGVAINQAFGGTTTDPNGPIVSATQPTVQSDGTPLANGDLWIDTANLENFPTIYKYNYLTKTWVLLDNTDHTTQNGVLFADARWSDQAGLTGTQSGLGAPDSIVSLLSSSFVDFDAPSAQLYPKGMILVNLRRTSFNVKRYVTGYVNTLNGYNTNMSGSPIMTSYYPDRWVSDAANDYQGVGQFGRKAQRAVVVQALNALIESNQNIRNEDSLIFDLLSCPGYLETTPALVSLNNDRGLLSFIVADAPARLTPDATSLSNWGNNTANATSDGEAGLITTDANTAVYYPWAETTDLNGNNIVVPPSHVMLRTIALSDNVSYPWFAPAGVRRGGVTNASSVGYVDGQTGEYVPTALNTGQRDTLASIQVNPITYIGGVGLVTYGQYTRQLVASALNRVNVARLVIYLRYQLNAISKPYVFEPNDTITRNEIKNQINAMLLNLTGQRALYDYIVVCDTSNNTPSRIDANELYVDIAIEPVKSVEFIYIPLRLENTGAIKGLGK
jgi:hypothetical protein